MSIFTTVLPGYDTTAIVKHTGPIMILTVNAKLIQETSPAHLTKNVTLLKY